MNDGNGHRPIELAPRSAATSGLERIAALLEEVERRRALEARPPLNGANGKGQPEPSSFVEISPDEALPPESSAPARDRRDGGAGSEGGAPTRAGASDETRRKPGDLALLWRMLARSKRYALQIPLVFVVSLLGTPLALLQPVPLAIAVDGVLGNKGLPGPVKPLLPDGFESYVMASDERLLVFAALATVLIAAVTQLQGVAHDLLSMWVGERLALDLRGDLFDHAQRVSLRYHDHRGASDAAYRIQNDATAIQSLTVGAIVSLIASSITLVAMVAVILLLDWQLALVALSIAPVLTVVSRSYKNILRERYRNVKALESSILGIIQEVLSSLRVVKTFGQEDREQERFVRASRESLRARVRITTLEGTLGLASTVITAGGTAAVLYLGVRHVQDGTLTLGALLLVMNYLTRLYSPIRSIANKLTRLQASLASAERLFELLDQPREVEEARHPRPLRRANGHLEFAHVSFSYDGVSEVLHDVSLEIPPGGRVGIAGPTGAGKSTLLGLPLRLYDPTRGEVRLDGTDIKLLSLRDLRRQFAVVLQDTVLFKATLAENIAYGRPDAHFDDIVNGAKLADAHRFIMDLPDGYDTPVGERGWRLSGGERQRISLARAFLKDSPILLLDEPTSSVDVRTEARIMEALERLMEGRTTLMIAHRLTTLEGCDIKFEIDAGRMRQVSVFSGSVGERRSLEAAGALSGA